MTIGKGKRPRDPNQLAEWNVERSTSETPEPEPVRAPGEAAFVNLSEYMSAIGRKGGQIGGKRRMKLMTPEQRKKIARKAAKARWKNAR